MTSETFDKKYKELNDRQREAVEAIEGPVMVVAGPGTGKTQVLACRIANILVKTDTKADSILCLTFTNSAVKEMRERLRKYIGAEAGKVAVSTFHSFGMHIVEKYFEVLGLETMPRIMDEGDSVALVDEILHSREWKRIRPKSDTSRYFRDLKGLISLLKREALAPLEFSKSVREEIERLQNDPESISSRGATKGELKKDVQSKISALELTLEAIEFYRIYESEKKAKALFDYDDVLEALVAITNGSEEAAANLREQYQYILVDEHQDSSGVQNRFLKSVWGEVEKPNIFVVGDDRQLIYGFGGASIEYFENFRHAFGKAKLVTLVDNYRSTQAILDASHALLQSSITEEKLKSNSKENYPLRLVEASYHRDEIISAGLKIKQMMEKDNLDPKSCAVLVPKNFQARDAITILKDLGLPVASGGKINFLDSSEAQAFLQVLRVIAWSGDSVHLGVSIMDPLSGIPLITAHRFAMAHDMRRASLLSLAGSSFTNDEASVKAWIDKLALWLSESHGQSLYTLIQHVGHGFLIDSARSHDELSSRVEVVRTMLHLALTQMERDPHMTLQDFLKFIDRLGSYGEHLPLSVFNAHEGVRVLTLHSSKGLEFDFVWIAHLDGNSFSPKGYKGFALPLELEDRIEKKDEEVLKRELYVAITRAKRFCTLSYARETHSGKELELSSIVASLEGVFDIQKADETERRILQSDPAHYTKKDISGAASLALDDIKKITREDYADRKVSVSLLNSFFECPWKWYFQNLLRLPEEQTESLAFGDIVHASIDRVLKSEAVLDQDGIQEIVERVAERSTYGNAVKRASMLHAAIDVVSEWAGKRLPEIVEDRENEKTVSVVDDRFPHLSIYGKIDLIEHLTDDSVRVTDFKTGNMSKKSDLLKRDTEGRMSDYMRQLAMYTYLIGMDSKWDTKVAESVLEFVQSKEDDGFIRNHIEKEHIELLVKDITDYDELVKSGEWTDRPCNFKSYGKKGAVCEYCRLKEQIFKAK